MKKHLAWLRECFILCFDVSPADGLAEITPSSEVWLFDWRKYLQHTQRDGDEHWPPTPEFTTEGTVRGNTGYCLPSSDTGWRSGMHLRGRRGGCESQSLFSILTNLVSLLEYCWTWNLLVSEHTADGLYFPQHCRMSRKIPDAKT